MTKYRKSSHVVFKCDYHIVWVPKYRFRILKGAIKELVDQDI
ncbi:IS200/IS605 family transposase, partial [Algoriphagus sp. D3-2-R+10]